MLDSVWDEGDGGSQEKQMDRVSQEDILSPKMQGLSELCSFKRDENKKKSLYFLLQQSVNFQQRNINFRLIFISLNPHFQLCILSNFLYNRYVIFRI